MVTMQQFAEDRRSAFERNVTNAIRMLIQDKHLYQSVLVPATDSYTVTKPDKTQVTEKLSSVTEVMNAGWATEAVRPGATPIHLMVPDIKVFCDRCKRVEAYNSVFVVEIFSKIAKLPPEAGPIQQAFLLAYQCASGYVRHSVTTAHSIGACASV